MQARRLRYQGQGFHWIVAAIVLGIAPFLLAASPPLTSIELGESLGSIDIVRCHFDEGRIVIRRGDKLHVLRQGSTLDATGLRVLEITPNAATLAIRQASPTGSLRLIRITGTDSNTLLLREFSTDPASLAGDLEALSPRAFTSAVVERAPPSPDSSKE